MITDDRHYILRKLTFSYFLWKYNNHWDEIRTDRSVLHFASLECNAIEKIFPCNCSDLYLDAIH